MQIPTQPWKGISVDFIEALPNSGGKTVIWVIIDRFTKFAHFVALQHPYTAYQLAGIYVEQVYKIHGFPSSIVSDRDRIFLSTFWQHLFKTVGTKVCISSSYHPQTDGQTERLNRCLENYLRCMCSSYPRRWLTWLALAQWWYNSNFHTALNTTPFQALFGFAPPQYNFQQIESTEFLNTSSESNESVC